MTENPVPEPQRSFLKSLISTLSNVDNIVGIAVGGSFASGEMDEFSDLDIVIGVEPDGCDAIMQERFDIASSLGQLAGAFTGEHVGEPRLLICLYANPALHVDLKFVSLDDVHTRVENPVVVWERDARFMGALQSGRAVYPQPDVQWIEDRFWVWTHYCATKIARGEVFESLDFLSFLRSTVLGPLSLALADARPQGVRKIENKAAVYCADLRATVAAYDSSDCMRALQESVTLYRKLSQAMPMPPRRNTDAEKVALEYIQLVLPMVQQAQAPAIP